MYGQGCSVPGESLLLGVNDQIRVAVGGQDAVVHVGVVPQQGRVARFSAALVGISRVHFQVGINPESGQGAQGTPGFDFGLLIVDSSPAPKTGDR